MGVKSTLTVLTVNECQSNQEKMTKMQKNILVQTSTRILCADYTYIYVKIIVIDGIV